MFVNNLNETEAITPLDLKKTINDLLLLAWRTTATSLWTVFQKLKLLYSKVW